MEVTKKLWVLVVLLAGLLLAACGPLAEAVPGQSVLPVEQTDAAVIERQALDAAPAPAALGTEIEFIGPVTSIGANEWVIGGQAVQVTPQTEIKAGVALGSVVKVHALPQTDGSLVAREIEAEAAAAGTATAQPGTPPAGSEQEFTGELTAVNGDVWTIGGRSVRITAATEVKGSFNIGDVLKVHASAGADGVLAAREVELAANASGGSDDSGHNSGGNDDGNRAGEQEFTGELTAINGSVWTIAGRQVRITSSTEVKGNLQIGQVLKVHASPASDGVLVAREVELAAAAGDGNDDNGNNNTNPSGEQEFTGVLSAINGGVWTVGGRAVRITASTEVKGSLNVGDVLKVHASPGSDGVWVAREVELAAGDDLNDDNGSDDNSGPGGGDDDGGDDNSGHGGDDNGGDDNSGPDGGDDDGGDDNSGHGGGDD
jgi:hypothetical protein